MSATAQLPISDLIDNLAERLEVDSDGDQARALIAYLRSAHRPVKDSLAQKLSVEERASQQSLSDALEAAQRIVNNVWVSMHPARPFRIDD